MSTETILNFRGHWKDAYNRNKVDIDELKPDFEYQANVVTHLL